MALFQLGVKLFYDINSVYLYLLDKCILSIVYSSSEGRKACGTGDHVSQSKRQVATTSAVCGCTSLRRLLIPDQLTITTFCAIMVVCHLRMLMFYHVIKRLVLLKFVILKYFLFFQLAFPEKFVLFSMFLCSLVC